MSIQKSVRLQLGTSWKALLSYGCIYIGVCLVLTTLLGLVFSRQGMSVGSMSGADMSGAIFIFVLELCSFKEGFLLHLQLGSSRRAMLAAHLITAVITALAVSLVNLLVMFGTAGIGALTGLFTGQSIFGMIYGLSGVGGLFTQLAVDFTLLLAISAFGYFTAALYYRMGTAAKVMVSVGVPGILLVLLPLLDNTLLGGAIGRGALALLQLAFGQPWAAVLSLLVLSVVFTVLAWLTARRANVK